MPGARKINNERFFRFVTEADLNAYTTILKPNQSAYYFNPASGAVQNALFKVGNGQTALANLPYVPTGGATAQAALVNAAGNISASSIPAGTSSGATGRPAAVPAGNFPIRINTTNAPPALEYWNGANWMTAGATVSVV